MSCRTFGLPPEEGETITKGAEKCAPRGNVVLTRLNSKQLGYWYSYSGSKEFVASAILKRRR